MKAYLFSIQIYRKKEAMAASSLSGMWQLASPGPDALGGCLSLQSA
jgi:hypothetical protein